MLKVGVSKIPHKDGEKVLDYHSIKYCTNGYADPKQYQPGDFDLLHLLTDKGMIRKGWWTGQEFWSARLTDDEHVIGWKKCKDLC
jgi:hypothetical protein